MMKINLKPSTLARAQNLKDIRSQPVNLIAALFLVVLSEANAFLMFFNM
jgi:hypothetical protein